MSPKKNYILKEEDLLADLNTIADYVIGNQSSEEVSFNERDTLPEALSFAMIHPESANAVRLARIKLGNLLRMVQALDKKLVLLETKIEVKKPKF